MKKGHKRRDKPELESSLEKKGKAQPSSTTPLQGIKTIFEKEGKAIFAKWRERLQQDERLTADPKTPLLATENMSALHKAVLTEDEREVESVINSHAKTPIHILSPNGSPLCWAATLGLIRIMRLLKRRGANPNWQDQPMSFAMRGNRPNVMEVLLELGATFSPTTMEELAKLYIIPALEYAATDSLSWLLEKIFAMDNEALALQYAVLLFVVGVNDFSSLIPKNRLENLLKEMCSNSFLIKNYICRFASSESIQILCSEKYQLTKFRDDNHGSIAHSAAHHGTETILAYLAETQPKLLEDLNKFGVPPALKAVALNHPKALQIICNRIKPAWQDPVGSGLGHYAAGYQSIQVLNYLAGTNSLSSPNNLGETPIVTAVQMDRLEAFKIIHSVDEKQILWQSVDENQSLLRRNHLGHVAAGFNAIKISTHFSKHHPKLLTEPGERDTPIAHAARCNSLPVLEIILELDKNQIEWKGFSEESLGHLASEQGSIAILNYFAEKYPQLLYKKNVFRSPPIVTAIKAGRNTVVEWFFQNPKRKKTVSEWKEEKNGNNLLHIASVTCDYFKLNLSIEFIEKPETDDEKEHNNDFENAINIIKVIRLLLKFLPKSSISEENEEKETPLGITKNPVFTAVIMLSDRNFFDHNIFSASCGAAYHSSIINFLSFYLFMCFAPKEALARPEPSISQAGLLEPVIAIISGYLIKTPMDFIFDEIVVGENPAAKDKLISDAIHFLYDDRFQRLPKQKEEAVSSSTEKSEVKEQEALNLLDSAKAIARKVEAHEYQESRQAQLLAEQWQQRQPSSSSSSSSDDVEMTYS